MPDAVEEYVTDNGVDEACKLLCAEMVIEELFAALVAEVEDEVDDPALVEAGVDD